MSDYTGWINWWLTDNLTAIILAIFIFGILLAILIETNKVSAKR